MSLSRMQKLGFRYLEEGEHAPEHAHVVSTLKGKKMYKKFEYTHIPTPMKKQSTVDKDQLQNIKDHVKWSNKNYEQISHMVANMFDNNVNKFPIVDQILQLPTDKSYVFTNLLSPDAVEKITEQYPDSTCVMFGDVLSDKALFNRVMKAKAISPEKIILTAFAGPYQKLLYVFHKLPFEAQVGKFLVSPIAGKSGVVFNPQKLALNSVIVFDSKANMMSFKKIKVEEQTDAK